MAGTKKKRKLAKKKESKSEILTFAGWSSGDMAYGIVPNGEIVYGEIQKFYPKDSSGPSVQIITLPDQKFRTVLVETLTEKKPTKKRIKK